MAGGAYDAEGHRNEKFLREENIGPFPQAAKEAWKQIKKEAMDNYGMLEGMDHEGRGKIGSLAEATPANLKNRGASNKRRRRHEEGKETGRNEEGSGSREGHAGG